MFQQFKRHKFYLTSGINREIWWHFNWWSNRIIIRIIIQCGWKLWIVYSVPNGFNFAMPFCSKVWHFWEKATYSIRSPIRLSFVQHSGLKREEFFSVMFLEIFGIVELSTENDHWRVWRVALCPLKRTSCPISCSFGSPHERRPLGVLRNDNGSFN